jgi:hypothetical protein
VTAPPLSDTDVDAFETPMWGTHFGGPPLELVLRDYEEHGDTWDRAWLPYDNEPLRACGMGGPVVLRYDHELESVHMLLNRARSASVKHGRISVEGPMPDSEPHQPSAPFYLLRYERECQIAAGDRNWKQRQAERARARRENREAREQARRDMRRYRRQPDRPNSGAPAPVDAEAHRRAIQVINEWVEARRLRP